MCYLMQKYYVIWCRNIFVIWCVCVYIYIQNIETLGADLEIRENKQVKDLYKKGELELENKDYVQTAFGRK